ncbi:MAG: UbiA family prenyltransferase [Candidatus Syntropharchaeales archaeon]
MSVEVLTRVKGHYQNLRIIDWRAYVAMVLFGYLLAGGLGIFYHQTTLYLMITTSCYLAFAFSVNNCFDLKEDIKSGKTNNPIAGGLISFKEALIISLGTAILGGVLSYIWFGGVPSLLFMLLLLLAFAYSVPPLRFKSRPPFDTLSHGLFFGALLFLFGFAVISEPSPTILLIALSIFVYSITIELKNHIKDYYSDLSAGTITTACWIGIDKTRKLFRVLVYLHFFILVALLYTFSRPILLIILLIMLLILIISPKIDERIPSTDVASLFAYLSLLPLYIF